MDPYLSRALASPKDKEKANIIIQRIIQCNDTKLNSVASKLELGNFHVSFLELTDLIQLCLSRRKPDEGNSKIKKFISFLAHNDFPVDLIPNPFVRRLITTKMLDIDQSTSGNLNRSGSTASFPKLKGANFDWYEKLDDVPK